METMTLDEVCHEAMMLEAVREAAAGHESGHGRPFGAVLAREGRIVAKTHNTALLTGDATDHAEMLAMRAGCALLGSPTLEGCVLYATGQPCMMCLGAAVTLKVDAVYYANTFEDAARLGSTGIPAGSLMLRVLGVKGGNFDGKFLSAEGLRVVHMPMPEALALYSLR